MTAGEPEVERMCNCDEQTVCAYHGRVYRADVERLLAERRAGEEANERLRVALKRAQTIMRARLHGGDESSADYENALDLARDALASAPGPVQGETMVHMVPCATCGEAKEYCACTREITAAEQRVVEAAMAWDVATVEQEIEADRNLEQAVNALRAARATASEEGQ